MAINNSKSFKFTKMIMNISFDAFAQWRVGNGAGTTVDGDADLKVKKNGKGN